MNFCDVGWSLLLNASFRFAGEVRVRRWSKTLLVGAALVAGWRLLTALSTRQQRRVDLSDNLSRWEGEGGNVPDVPEVQPSPPASSRRS